MPAMNHTIDDISPLITYTGASWHESTPALDPLISQYSNDTFTLCYTAGSYATFTFNGTAVWIFGAKRPNHGPYSVSLDNVTTKLEGVADPAVFQTPLFSATSLAADTTHTVVITNLEIDPKFKYLDLDFITWTTTGESANTTVVHTHEAAFSYEPASAWLTNTTIKSTSSRASAIFSFTGDEVTLYGAVGPTSGPYTVSLDNGIATAYNATKLNPTDQVPLYHASNLGPGKHTLNITNTPASAGHMLGINYAIAVPIPTTGATGSVSSSRVKNGAIVGIAVGGVAALLFAVLLFVFLRRRRRSRQRGSQDPEKSKGGVDLTALLPFVVAQNVRTGNPRALKDPRPNVRTGNTRALKDPRPNVRTGNPRALKDPRPNVRTGKPGALKVPRPAPAETIDSQDIPPAYQSVVESGRQPHLTEKR